MRRLLILLIRFYQYTISPYLATSCRFTPGCSQYAVEAVQRYGVVRGGWMACRRLLRCHPWHTGGLDPVPGNEDDQNDEHSPCCHHPHDDGNLKHVAGKM